MARRRQPRTAVVRHTGYLLSRIGDLRHVTSSPGRPVQRRVVLVTEDDAAVARRAPTASPGWKLARRASRPDASDGAIGRLSKEFHTGASNSLHAPEVGGEGNSAPPRGRPGGNHEEDPRRRNRRRSARRARCRRTRQRRRGDGEAVRAPRRAGPHGRRLRQRRPRRSTTSSPATLAGPLELPAGTYSVAITASGCRRRIAPAIGPVDLPLEAGKDYTAVAHLTEAGAARRATLFTNDISQTAAGQGRLTRFGMSPPHRPSTCSLAARRSSPNLTNPNEQVLNLPAGVVSASVAAAGTTDPRHRAGRRRRRRGRRTRSSTRGGASRTTTSPSPCRPSADCTPAPRACPPASPASRRPTPRAS